VWLKPFQGDVFDVSGKETYAPGKGYHGASKLLYYITSFETDFGQSVFAGKEPNRALGLSSLKPEDCISDFSELSDKEKQVLNDWHTFFSKRYNIVGRLQPEDTANL
jgi:membrane-associated progesterone receptor component